MFERKNLLVLLIFGALFSFLWMHPKKENFTSDTYCSGDSNPEFSQQENGPDIIRNPAYLDDTYAKKVIDKQSHQIKRLRKKLRKMTDKLDDVAGGARRKLSNKYYRPKPFLAQTPNASMNLNDGDFSAKTLSTTKFLSQTRSSKFYGDEIHLPSELCANYCVKNDKNAQLHPQIDSVRPIGS